MPAEPPANEITILIVRLAVFLSSFEFQAMPGRTHHDENWQRRVSVERERYAVLLHLYTYGELTPASCWTEERIMRDLGFSRERAELVLSTLVDAGFLRRSAPGQALALTPEAIAYLEAGAGRRRSVRLRD